MASPTVSITVRIPIELRSRMDSYMLSRRSSWRRSRNGRTWPRVTQQSLVVAAIASKLDAAEEPASKHVAKKSRKS